MDSLSIPSLRINNCVAVKLTERTYLVWKVQFESFLSGQGYLGFITCKLPPPKTLTILGINNTSIDVTNPDFSTWCRVDNTIKAWLLGSFSDDILSITVSCSTSQDIWSTLEKHFARVSSSRLFELQRKLQTVTKNEKSMSDYLKEVRTMCDQLASVGPVSEDMKIFAALHGLGRDYEPIKTSIESTHSVPMPSFEDVIPKLIGFDDRLQSYVTDTAVSPHVAFNTMRASGQYNNRGRNSYVRPYGRGKGSFSTQGRGFHQQISSGSYGSNSMWCVRSVEKMVILLSNVGIASITVTNTKSFPVLLRL